METAIHIGASKETIIAARAAILDILKASCEDLTKRSALEAFTTVCQVNGASISNCNFTMGKQK